MIRYVAVILTLLSTVLHAAFGCHWHHGCPAYGGCSTTCTHQAEANKNDETPNTPEKGHRCSCHHDTPKPTDDNKPSQKPDNDKNVPDNDGENPSDHTPCDAANCSLVVVTQSTIRIFLLETAFDVFLINDSVDNASANTQLDSCAVVTPIRFGCAESVRAHLFHQVWLL